MQFKAKIHVPLLILIVALCSVPLWLSMLGSGGAQSEPEIFDIYGKTEEETKAMFERMDAGKRIRIIDSNPDPRLPDDYWRVLLFKITGYKNEKELLTALDSFDGDNSLFLDQYCGQFEKNKAMFLAEIELIRKEQEEQK